MATGETPVSIGGKAHKRGISNEYICICTGIGCKGDFVAVSLNRVKPSGDKLKAAFKGYLDEDSLVIRNDLKPYRGLSAEYGCSVKDINLEMNQYTHLNNTIQIVSIAS